MYLFMNKSSKRTVSEQCQVFQRNIYKMIHNVPILGLNLNIVTIQALGRTMFGVSDA